jgi:hypothetical protein
VNNQPAFPSPYDDAEGMTLRDYFAAKAMEAFVAGWVSTSGYPKTDMVVAEHAYAMADAMLKAREQ